MFCSLSTVFFHFYMMFFNVVFSPSLAAQSVMFVPGIHLARDPGHRSTGFVSAQGKSRRQSMLL